MKSKSVIRGLTRYVIRVIITAIIIMALTFILSNILDKEFKVLLEYAALIVISIGGFSVVGGRSLPSNYVYNRSKPTRRTIEIGKSDMDLINESYRFLIFMVLVGVVLLVSILAF